MLVEVILWSFGATLVGVMWWAIWDREAQFNKFIDSNKPKFKKVPSKLSQIFVDFPPYNAKQLDFFEYKRWQNYCVKINCLMEYSKFTELCIYPDQVKLNPLDNFLD